ncbi:MAG TPA: tyrosine-type recombinase/integrase, partial [Steroidobacteraceae bacterium]|nr:tyrosine-type recombinase/integrase [Steroidobacteraceae bacterium]
LASGARMSALTARRLTSQIEAFLIFKRALGYSYRRNEATLRSFERFARNGRPQSAPIDLATLIQAWLQRVPGRKPVTLACDLGALRQFCQYRRRLDPRAYVPPVALAPQTESHYVPHIFSPAEIRSLLAVASRHEGRNFWPGLCKTLLLVTYCTGLRLGEAVRLQCSDLDLPRRVLHIRASKGRSRDVPFQADLARVVRQYLPERAEVLAAKGAHDVAALFVGRNGRGITIKAASGLIRELLRQLGLKNARGRVGPRPYDLRHAFAVHRLTAWYREGVDLNARLPWLSAYMGHVNVLGTEVYLHATPELLQLASERLAAHIARSGGGS